MIKKILIGVLLLAINGTLLKAAMQRFEYEPGLFTRTWLQADNLTEYQSDALKAFLTEDYVSIKSANAMGKSFTLSRAMLEALYVLGNKYGEIYIIATAPDFNIIKNVLFSEVRSAHANAKFPLGGAVNLTEIKIRDKWHMLGFSPRRSTSSDNSNFQGFHAKLVIIVFEEATGIPRDIWEKAGAMTTTGRVKMWAIGNPTDNNTYFAETFKNMKWVNFTWDCFKSPNLKANNIKNLDSIREEMAKIQSMKSDIERREYLSSYKMPRPELLTARSVIEQALEYGTDSPLFVGRVLAEFPALAVNTLVPIWRIEECMSDTAEAEGLIKPEISGAYRIGVDVARYGDDMSEIKIMRGNVEVYAETIMKQDTVAIYNRTRALAIERLEEPAEVIIGVDVTGLGSGVFDMIVNDTVLSGNNRVHLYQINFGANAVESDKFASLASELADYTRKKISSPEGIKLYRDMQLLNEMTNRRFKFDVKTRFALEPKDDYKRRNGGKSPDKADALIIACGLEKLHYHLSGAGTNFKHDNRHNAVAYKNFEW